MIANLQRLGTILLMAVASAWCAGFVIAGRPLVAVLGASLLVFGYAAILAVELLAVFFVGDSALEPRATPLELLRAWCGEVVASPAVFFWRQPFRTNAEPDVLPLCPDGRRGVLLVHGFVCNRAFWNPWMTKLRRLGISFMAINLEPPFGSIASHASTIDRAVQRLTDATGAAPLVVAHSMGGLVVRHWCSTTTVARRRVHRVITIGTPHRGTWLAQLSRSLPGSEMALNSPWLAQLDDRMSWERNPPFVCFYGNADNVVFPARGAMLPQADNRLVRATAHVQLAFHPSVFEETLRCLG